MGKSYTKQLERLISSPYPHTAGWKSIIVIDRQIQALVRGSAFKFPRKYRNKLAPRFTEKRMHTLREQPACSIDAFMIAHAMYTQSHQSTRWSAQFGIMQMSQYQVLALATLCEFAVPGSLIRRHQQELLDSIEFFQTAFALVAPD